MVFWSELVSWTKKLYDSYLDNILKQLGDTAQKDDFNVLIPATIFIFSGANPARVSLKSWFNNDFFKVKFKL